MNIVSFTGDLPPLALIAGPTASGKSALALALAEQRPSIIINADAMQVYRDLRVVTARPSLRDESRHTHALFGDVDGGTPWSAATWARTAQAVIAAAHAEGRLPILVGGSGLYVRTLLEGIAPVPDIDPAVRAAVRAMPVADAHAVLMREDIAAAARLAPADTTRVARALEVVRATGMPLAHWQRERCGGIARSVRLAPLVLAPAREELFARIDARFAIILGEGLDEVTALLARHLDPALPVMRAIGVREVAALLAGRCDQAGALAAGRLASRQYAKRQTTWFARQSPCDWARYDGSINSPDAVTRAISLLEQALTR